MAHENRAKDAKLAMLGFWRRYAIHELGMESDRAAIWAQQRVSELLKRSPGEEAVARYSGLLK